MLLAIFHMVTFPAPKCNTTSPIDGIPFEQVWYNSCVTPYINIITDTVIQFILIGIIQEKHLCEIKSYEPKFR